MNWTNIWTITRKDWMEVRYNKAVWMPMIIVPLVFVLILPLSLCLLPQMLPADQLNMNMNGLDSFLNNMPAGMKASLAGLDLNQSMIVMVLGILFAPMFLVLPLMFSTTVAAESFVGERERKTMEALLYTPATDAELFLGKVLAAAIPAVVISWGSFAIYTLVVNAASYPLFQHIWFPLSSWWPLIFWITPAVSVLGIAVTVLISGKMQTFMEAYQTSASVVLLVLALFAGQMTGVLYLNVAVGLVLGLFFWVVAGLLSWFAVRKFNRAALLTSQA